MLALHYTLRPYTKVLCKLQYSTIIIIIILNHVIYTNISNATMQ